MHSGIDLPGIHFTASQASLRAKKLFTYLNVFRVAFLFLAAIFGSMGVFVQNLQVLAMLLMFCIFSAIFSEILLLYLKPERDWGRARALAEYVKTLSWRFAVQGDPFGSGLNNRCAERLLREEIMCLLDSNKGRVKLRLDDLAVTESMKKLRKGSLTKRRKIYLEKRIENQHKWYIKKSNSSYHSERMWKNSMIIAELITLIFAALSVFFNEYISLVSIFSSFVASGSGWVVIRKYSHLNLIYASTAASLAFQVDSLRDANAKDWPGLVLKAEETILAEHRSWLVERGGLGVL